MKHSEKFRERDGWFCPESVRSVGTQVLYRAVAYWALFQGRGVTVSEVSEAFGIPHRRASDVLHYIVHNASSAIRSRVSLRRGDGNGLQKVVRVWRVYPQHFPQTDKVATQISGLSKKRPSRGGGEEIQRLRTWFLSRRLGESIPQMLSASDVSEQHADSALNRQNCGQ
ncbi:CaiF/GrlA family transcriptional regulator [Salmonella enterica subsp. enterica serovar Urbana]|nr:CaiF/GrlA family transcriptional regulator [Salmonella enterica subsp. enterica serovar Urbana]